MIGREHDPERDASLYVSGEFPRRLTRWFEQHLLDCEDCWREVLLARRGRFVAEHARELAPATLREGVRSAVQLTAGADPSPRGRRFRALGRGRR